MNLDYRLCSLIEALARRIGAGLEWNRTALQIDSLKLLSLYWDALDKLELYLELADADLLSQATRLAFEARDILRGFEQDRLLLAVA